MQRSSAPRIAPRDGIIDEIRAAIGADFIEAKHEAFEDSVTVRRENIVDVLRTLRDGFE
jgi:NADH-quinone oxidoreductase subunit C